MASGAVSANVREELERLEAAGDELSKRTALALQTLLDDLAKAHADAASNAVNNEQRFHQLEQETVAARSETERVTKLKDDAERKREHSEARIASLSNEVTAANAKAENAVGELRKMVQQLEEAVRQRGLPLMLLRAEDEGSAHLEVRKGVGVKHLAHHDGYRIPGHGRPLLWCRSDEFRLERVIHASWRTKVGNTGSHAHARTRQDGDGAATVR